MFVALIEIVPKQRPSLHFGLLQDLMIDVSSLINSFVYLCIFILFIIPVQ